MTDFRDRYKRLGFDPEANRALRTQRRDEARRGLRDEQMSLRREMGATNDADDSSSLDGNKNYSSQSSGLSAFSQESASYQTTKSHEDSKSKAAAEYEAAVQQRWERLQKWRAEKTKRKQIEKKKAKPVFKVGVVHHKVYSPPVNKEPAQVPPPKLCKSRDISTNMSQAAPKRVTRATEKRLAVKTMVNQQKRENVRSKKKTQPKVHATNEDDKQVEIAPKDHTFRAPVGVTPMPIFGRHALEATKQNIQAEINSFKISSTYAGACSESFNESSGSLKLSEDQEMLDVSMTNEAKSPVSRHSLKNLSPPAADEATAAGATPSDQEMMECEQFSKIEKSASSFSASYKVESPVEKRKSQKVPASPVEVAVAPAKDKSKRKSVVQLDKEIAVSSPRRKRSTRVADKRKSVRIESTDSADSGIEPSLTPVESVANRRRSIKVASADSETDSTPVQIEKPSTSSRRISSKVDSESVLTPPKKSINKRRSSKFVTTGSTDNEEDTFVKPAASSRRKSTMFTAEVEASTRFTINGQDAMDVNNTNLMDFTFSAPAKPPKVADVPKSLLDDTVSNLTPRRSSRLPTGPSTGNPDEDQPLIRFSSFYVPTPADNEVSADELAKERNLDEILNLSLNMSLPSETEELQPPAFFSPYIVQSRGKTSAMKEMKKRRFSQPGLDSDDIPTKENIMQKLNISLEEEERTSQYYKLILNKEIERLNELCERWDAIKEDPETPEESRYIIQAACGQTRLLINKKFERFRSLVQDCETGRGEMLVTCKDLQGFWDMMYMEINDCESRFNKLEESKANNWIVKDEVAAVERKKKKAPAKKPAIKKAAAGKPSSLRAMIAAARKKKAQADGSDEASEETTAEPAEKPVVESSEKPSTPMKTISRLSSTPKSSNKWDTLLKKVQLSQTRKSTTSPLVVMKLSQMVKTPEVQLDDSIVYINSGRTPAKSILKKDEVMGPVSKSTNKVFFQEQSNEVKEFERRNSFVDHNMSLDNIEEMKEPIERKLTFEDDSFVENIDEKNEESESPFVANSNAGFPEGIKLVTRDASPIISMSPLSLEDKKTTSKKKSTKTRKISFKEDADESQPRSLRTRKFSAPLTPKPKRRDQEDDEDMSMEVEDSEPGKSDTPRPQLIKEIYLNEQGVVCERFVSAAKDTPGTSKLKRSNSQVTPKSRKSTKNLETDELMSTPSTPRPRRRTVDVPQVKVFTPKSVLKELSWKTKPASPRSLKQSLKRSSADTTLTQENTDISMEETATPKISKRTPKTVKVTSELQEKSTQSSALKRTRSLKITNNEESSVIQTASPKVRRTKSLNIKKVDAEDSPKEALKEKIAKKLQENIEPNEQETDRSTKRKLSKTPSINRKSSKKQLETVDSKDKLTNYNDTISDTMTPNTRRKSLRITRASIRNEH